MIPIPATTRARWSRSVGACSILNVKAQKYVNSSDTPVFIKSRVLFGLNKSKRPIIEAESAILCEGQIDLMRCWQHGIRNVVAPQGTAFTDNHARILKRIAKEIIVCFDADRAGPNAAQRSIDVTLKEDPAGSTSLRIPQGEDPDSLLLYVGRGLRDDLCAEAKALYTAFARCSPCEEGGHPDQSRWGAVSPRQRWRLSLRGCPI